MPTDHTLTCPFCASEDVTPFPDPTAAWSCLDCARVFRVELVQPASVSGWGVLRAVRPTPAAPSSVPSSVPSSMPSSVPSSVPASAPVAA